MNEVLIKQEMCRGCQFCIKACPKGQIQLSGKLNLNGFNYAAFKGHECTACGFCFYACPELDALEVHPDKVAEEAKTKLAGLAASKKIAS